MRLLIAGVIAVLAAPACLAQDGGLAAPPVAHGHQASDETPPACSGQEPRDCSSGLIPLCNQGQWYCGSPGDTILPGVSCPPGQVKDAGQGCFAEHGSHHGDGHDGRQKPDGVDAAAAHHHDDANGGDNDKDDAPHGAAQGAPPAAGQ